MVEHVDIADGERHEPKGIATANAGEVYRADGAQSGDWKQSAAYATICSVPADAVAISTIGTTVQKFAGFTTEAANSGITVSAANDNLTIVTAGVYLVSFTISFSTAAAGDAGIYEFILRIDGVETNFGLKREMSGSNDTGAAGFTALLSLSANEVLDIQIESDNGGDTDDINVEYTSLTAALVSAT